MQYYVFASQSAALKLSCIHDPSCRAHVYMMDHTYTVHVWIAYDPYKCQKGTLKDNHTQTYLL